MRVSNTVWSLAAAAGLVLAVGCNDQQEMKTDPPSQADGVASVDPDSPAITGRCHCGAVTYHFTGPVVKTSQCDCAGCRRATGTFAAPFVIVAPKDFQIDSGKTATYDARGGKKCDRHGVWHFCRQCGGPLYWADHRGKQVDVFAGTLDDPSHHPESKG